MTGEIPVELGNRDNLGDLSLGGNLFTGCVPDGLKRGYLKDFDEIGLPFCEVTLSSLTIEPGSLVPSFNPNYTVYTISVIPSRITVTPTTDDDAFFLFLGENDVAIADADAALEGHQVDFGLDVPVIKIRVETENGRATRTYAITSQDVGPCSDGGAVLNAADNLGLAFDCNALLAARDTLAGSATLNWSADTHMGEWEGVTLAGWPLRVTELDLSARGLTGELPTELGNLTNLRHLYLSANRLTGNIPVELANLRNLRITSSLGKPLVRTNTVLAWDTIELEFVGPRRQPIDRELYLQNWPNLANLKLLWLNQNQLIGADTSPNWANLQTLQSLWLHENQLIGEIPAWLAGLEKLQSLNLGSNQLTGEIPAWLGHLTNLIGAVHIGQSVDRRDSAGTGQIEQTTKTGILGKRVVPGKYRLR